MTWLPPTAAVRWMNKQEYDAQAREISAIMSGAVSLSSGALRPSVWWYFQIQEMLCLSLFCINNIIKLICRCFRRAMSALTDTLLSIPQCHLYLASILCVPCQLKVSQYPRCHALNACQLKVALSFVFFRILMSPLRGSLASMPTLSPLRDTFLYSVVTFTVTYTWHISLMSALHDIPSLFRLVPVSPLRGVFLHSLSGFYVSFTWHPFRTVWLFGLCLSVPFSVLPFLCRHAWRSVFLKRLEVLYACLPFLGRKEKEESESPIAVRPCRSAAACVEVKRKKKGKQAVTE